MRAHVLLILFCSRQATLMTRQLYHDLPSMIREIFSCALKVQKHCPPMPLFLLQIGTDAL